MSAYGLPRTRLGWTKDLTGLGFLAGSSPAGLASVDGEPANVDISIYNVTAGAPVAVQQLRSNGLGKWQVDNLPLENKYMVIGRTKNGFHNAVIWDHISPQPYIDPDPEP